MVMPALVANTVTLEEVLEVRGGPLNEQELWSILTQACEALQDVFIKGNARKRHFGTCTITPTTILLCHKGTVKFSLDGDSPNDRSFTAPETYARRAFPSEAALEKICVYSLGMSLYHAAEYEVPVGKPISLDESLEYIILTMCEDSAKARSNIEDILQECHSRYMRRNYRDVVASLVESLLGDDILDVELEDTGFDNEAFQNDTSDYHIERVVSPVLAIPRHLPTPPPPQISTRGQVTSAQLVGSNNRPVPSVTQSSGSPRSNESSSRNLPPSLEKYKSFLEESRSKRSMTMSLNGLDQLDSREPHTSQPPTKQGHTTNTRHSPRYQEVGRYYVQPPTKPPHNSESRLKVNGTQNGAGYGLRRYSSVNSVTSNSSSTASGPRSSMFSDGRSSSAISLTQGSYAPESYFTDGYESEFYLNSLGSSVSRTNFRNGRGPQISREQQYLSVNDLGDVPSGALPNKHLPPIKQFTSLPDISKDLPSKTMDNDKTFYGPEFVMITEDPEKSIVNITPNAYLKKDAQKKSGTQNRKMVTVVALNGQKLQLMAEVSMTTKELYEHVIKFLGITEKSLFGLAKVEDDEVIFLELDVKLSKYAPTKWKEPKGEMVEFILYFRVKFYVEHTSLLSHLSSRHQFYLQLRKDILEGRLYCHEEAAFLLAGLALQAETGDYVETLDQDYFLVEHYLHPRIINKVSAEYAVSQLPEFHQHFAGLNEKQAELDFVEEAQKLPEYGIHFYKVQASKKADAERLYLGVCVRGVTVYESMGQIKSPIHKHSWPLTKKISFKKKKFFIEPRANPDGAKLTFYTSNYKKAKYLLSMCKAFHRFQMQMRTRLASIEHEVALDFASEKHQHQSVDSPCKTSPYERTPPPPAYRQSSIDPPRNTLLPSVSQGYKQNTDDLRQDRYKEYSVDINHNIGHHGDDNSIHEKNKGSNAIQPMSPDELNAKHDELPYVIDSTLNEQRKLESNQQDVVKASHTKELEVPNTKDIIRSPDRETRVIKLRKEPSKGLGITVLGGDNSKRLDLGIYVKSITEVGAAAKDGRLKAGDRILAVNGNSLEHVTHEKAVSLLKTTSSTVELVVSQSPHNVSALDLSSIPSAASTNEEPQTLEVKPLITPPQHNSRPKKRVESPWSSDTQSPTESGPSTFNFPSEDEPVTMISKSISSLAAPVNQTTQVSTAASKPSRDTYRFENNVPEPVTMEVVQSLSSAPTVVTSQTKSPLAETRLSSLDSHQSQLSSESYTAGSERSTDQEISDKTFSVELEKVNGSLGLSVTGGINTTVKHGAIYVKSLILNGPADMNGHVRVGDRILEVNDISLKAVTHKQAVEIIKRAPQHCRILIDRSIHVNVQTSIKTTSSRNQNPDKPFSVELRKGIGGLGLSLVGGRDAEPEHGGLLRIKKMFPGQPAALSHKLVVGDIVLEVNGNTLKNASHQDAINMIRLEPSVVRLLIKREPSSIPAVLLERAASDASDIDPVQLLNDIQSKLRTDTVKSPPQSRPTLELTNHRSRSDPPIDELTNHRHASDRTEVWVRQESPGSRPHDLGFENERSLTYQFSDPLTSRYIEHEPVTSSNSLPGKFTLKSRHAEKVVEEIETNENHSTKIHDDVERRDSNKIRSESDISSLLNQIKSQDSLHRTLSPCAPLAEYEESDIDEGIMINVDDGTVVNISDDDNHSSSEDENNDRIQINAAGPALLTTKDDNTTNDDDEDHDDQDHDDQGEDRDGHDEDDHDDDEDHDDDDDEDRDHDYDGDRHSRSNTDQNTNNITLTNEINYNNDDRYNKYQGPESQSGVASNIIGVMDKNVNSDGKNDSDNNDSIDDSEEDIDSVLELLDAIHKGESTNSIENHDDKIVLDMQVLQQTSPANVELTSIRVSESEPEMIREDDKHEDLVEKMPLSPVNGVLNDRDDGTSSDSDVSIDESKAESGPLVNGDSSLTAEDESDISRLTPKEELLTVELEKGDSGGLGFTLAGGADTTGGCFVREIVGDPAKADGRLRKGDQILQVDDVDIRDMKHMAAVNVLRATKKKVKLIVLRRPTTMVVNEGSSLESVNLTRTSRGRIGLLLTEGEDGVILVDDVVPGEPAAVQGNLKHGDRIVEIGGHKVDGIGFLAARQYLDASRPVVQLLVERKKLSAFSKYSMGGLSLEQSLSLSEDLVANLSQSDGEHTDDNNESDVDEQTDEVIKVELDKGTRGFGFSLVAAPSSEPNVQGIFIKTISPASVAEKDGRLRVGDQLLTVNQEDVHGLSHARVIGMLRKVTTTVTLEIKRPAYGTRPAKQTSSKSPPANGLDLEITLEDKDTLTGAPEDEDNILDLVSAISSTTAKTTSPTKPKLSKRNTDTVLSSILNSIGSPAHSSNTNNLSEVENNDSDSDTDYLPVDTGSSSSQFDNSIHNNMERFSSGSLDDKQYDSSTDRLKTDLEVSSDSDSNYDDVDVFDMLHDNSESNKQENRTIGSYVDFPPPLPITPIPSDDEDLPPLPPRRESLNKSSDDGWSSESDFSSQPKVNGFVSLHSSSEEEMLSKPTKPLVNVPSSGRYSGHKLKMLIGALHTKLNSNTPSEEFKALREIKPTDGCDAAKHPENKEKNRYRNVLPFNSTRVRLGGVGNEDYINASHVRVPVGQDTHHYIATQGPLPNTTKDFWQMVWEQGVEVIAMLTLEQEGGKVKCSRYWPDVSDTPLYIPSFQITLLNKKTSHSFVERTLSLKHLESGESLEITHLNFISWPDHGVPKCSIEMVQFVTYMRSLPSTEAPILVHCSAGIGRTGALITVDVALALIQRDQMFDVDKIIRILREQRQGMIQTKDQYIFCYKACLDVLRSLNG